MTPEERLCLRSEQFGLSSWHRLTLIGWLSGFFAADCFCDSMHGTACVNWLRSLNVLCMTGLQAVILTVVERRMNLLNLCSSRTSA